MMRLWLVKCHCAELSEPTAMVVRADSEEHAAYIYTQETGWSDPPLEIAPISWHGEPGAVLIEREALSEEYLRLTKGKKR